MKFQSLKFKVTFLYTAILGVILVLYSFILYYSLRHTLYNELADKLVMGILEKRAQFIILSIPIILLVISLTGRMFVKHILGPVAEVTSVAKNISHEDLSRRVKKNYVDQEMQYLVTTFNGMIGRLEKSFKHIAEFSSHAAHELKTPLAIIRGESELALAKERSPDEYKRTIKTNLEEVHRMLKIVEDLLLLTKLEHRPEMFKFEQFSLNEFLKEIYQQAQLLAAPKNISINFQVSLEEIAIRADKIHLRRLFFNLIHNAVKFTSEKGEIEIGVRHEGEKVFVYVTDTGIGITPEDLPKIFNKFFHINRTDQNLEPGNGLGLNIAQTIAKAHNGTIEVNSQFKKGSTFTVILPSV